MEVNYDLFVNTLFMKAQAKGIPLSGSFELTARCNFDCRMCYIHRRSRDREALMGEKNADWWVTLAKQAKEHGTLLLLLTGGEPSLTPPPQRLPQLMLMGLPPMFRSTFISTQSVSTSPTAITTPPPTSQVKRTRDTSMYSATSSQAE